MPTKNVIAIVTEAADDLRCDVMSWDFQHDMTRPEQREMIQSAMLNMLNLLSLSAPIDAEDDEEDGEELSAREAVSLARDREEAARIAAASGDEFLAKNFNQLARYLRAYARLRDGLSDPAAQGPLTDSLETLCETDCEPGLRASAYETVRREIKNRDNEIDALTAAMGEIARCANPSPGCGHTSADDCLDNIEAIARRFAGEDA